MKKILQGAALVGALFVLSGCASGPVIDKRAPGVPGDKKFQVLVDNDAPVGPDKLWVTVTEQQWDECRLDEQLSRCTG